MSNRYNVISHTEVSSVARKDRADYFRERRRSMRQYAFLIDKERAEKFEKKLKEKNLGKTEWFRQKIDEEISK
nr:MAG TPA: antitoxin [Bacteriophage sp.]